MGKLRRLNERNWHNNRISPITYPRDAVIQALAGTASEIRSEPAKLQTSKKLCLRCERELSEYDIAVGRTCHIDCPPSEANA